MAITIYDVAEQAGVSIATVSRVFNRNGTVSKATCDRVMHIANELGYHPQIHAQGLAGKKSNVIMALVPVMSNYFFMEVLGGIQDKLLDSDYELNIFNVTPGKDAFEQVERVLKKRGAAGYVFISLHFTKSDWQKLHTYAVPVALIDECYASFDSISVDNIEGAYKAVSYLIEQGFERVALLSARQSSLPARDRLEGYKKALKEHGIRYDKSLVSTGNTTYRDGFTEKAGYEAMVILLSSEAKPDACFCISDIQAVGAQKAMRDLNQWMPLIGYDDIELAEYIGLSTVRQPMRDMGFYATQTLIDRMADPGRAVSKVIYTPELVVRSSTRKPPVPQATRKGEDLERDKRSDLQPEGNPNR
ncbi:MAG: LacI family DNA-binding transcriptional regulator [Bacteroidota bacterium]